MAGKLLFGLFVCSGSSRVLLLSTLGLLFFKFFASQRRSIYRLPHRSGTDPTHLIQPDQLGQVEIPDQLVIQSRGRLVRIISKDVMDPTAPVRQHPPIVTDVIGPALK